MQRRLPILVGVTLGAATLSIALAGAATPVLTLPPSPIVVYTAGEGAVVDYTVTADDSGTPVIAECTPAGGSQFARGTTTVTCTANNGVDPIGSGTFAVTVVGPPTLSLPPDLEIIDGDTTVSFNVTAADELGPVTPSCNPSSPHQFALGPTTVTCSATTSAGTTSGSFTVTVTNTIPPPVPSLGGPGGTTNDTTPTFTFTSTGANDFVCSVDGPTPKSLGICTSPFTTSTLADGHYVFSVAARNISGIASAAQSAGFTVDTAPPETTVTTNVPSLTTSSGLSIAFAASESGSTFACSLDSAPFSSCSSPAGLADLLDGIHRFMVRAQDAAGNTDATPAVVTWVVDTTPPALNPIGPLNKNVEADGPNGTAVDFSVSASDDGVALLPSAISCLPGSGSGFPLGNTLVSCNAKDKAGNTGALTFSVAVVDTRAPTINAPNVSFTATNSSGVARTDRSVSAYLAGISANDLVSTPSLSTNAPAVFPIGKTTLVVTARDAAGNTASKSVTVTVLQPGTLTPPVDLTPPGRIGAAKATAGDGRVVLTWTRPAGDVTRVEVHQSIVGESRTENLAYSGLGSTVTSKGLRNGARYRFVLVAFDAAGNSSPSVVVTASPRALLLARPRPGDRVTAPPLLRWAPVPSSYFNVQLYRGGVKILSNWPVTTHLQLKAHWTYKGRTITLKPGVYTWYVWPGLGDRADVRYGQLLGKSGFAVIAPKQH
jgi:hypothetical protein